MKAMHLAHSKEGGGGSGRWKKADQEKKDRLQGELKLLRQGIFPAEDRARRAAAALSTEQLRAGAVQHADTHAEHHSAPQGRPQAATSRINAGGGDYGEDGEQEKSNAGRCVARRRRSILLHRARLRCCGCVVRSLELLRHARCAQGGRVRRVIRSGCVLCSTAQRTERRVARRRRGRSRPSCTSEMLRMRVSVPRVAPSRSLRARRPPKASNSVGLCSVQY